MKLKKKTDLKRASTRPEAQYASLSSSELEACIEGLRDGLQSCPRELVGKAVRFCASLLEEACPGESLEVRVVPFAACKVLQGTRPDPHNLTPPDFLEMDPDIFLRLSFGLESWQKALPELKIPQLSRAKELEAFFPLLSVKK
ncbi:MAG: hypothetical protein IKS61_02425 [Aeriscardovia sp.]|nr:hypothetical protein [Aeriscardovia sp.]